MTTPSDRSSRLARARFYAILDTVYVAPERWARTCAALIAGGSDLIQIRAKRETPSERERLLREVQPLFAHAGAAAPFLIVNDDVDLCARFPGVGLHIGQDDTPPAEARRRIGPDRMIGLSTHSWMQAQAAQQLAAGWIDYFCVGPVFSTQTKPDYEPVGLDLVRRMAVSRPSLPWFAIGGIKRGNVAQVAASGAPRVVVVSDVLLDADPAGAVRSIISTLEASARLPGPA